MNRRLTVIATVIAMALATAVSWGVASPAQAGSCWSESGSATDPDGNSWSTLWWCGNDSGALLYRDANYSTTTGVMDTTSSWFVCYRYGVYHDGGNNVWYYSQGDRSAGAGGRSGWGFMPAINVWTSTDPWPGMAECRTSAPPPPTTTAPPPTTTAPGPGAPTGTAGHKTVVFVHGYKATMSVNCASYWGNGTASGYFSDLGWSKDQLDFVTYYLFGGGGGCHRIARANLGTPIEDVGVSLAWYIWDHYTSQGKTVDIVAHSMGGLVARTAIAGTTHHRTTNTGKTFPPYLYVEDVVTLSTPHEGSTVLAGIGCTLLEASATGQCLQMGPYSPFMTSWINRAGYENPQSQISTDWSAVGSGDDGVVNTGSALNRNASDHFGHKYLYESGSGLSHGQMANIANNGGRYYTMRSCHFFTYCTMSGWESGTWYRWTTAQGPLWVAAAAVFDGTW